MERSMWCSIVLFTFITNIIGAYVEKIETYTANYESIKPAAQNEILLQEKNYWKQVGEKEIKQILKQLQVKDNVAKNVIMFVGDGMGVTTTTAARIYKGQRKYESMGEEHTLSFDAFPNVALVKTYTVDKQVPDSAGTATALFTGVKTRMRVIGMDVNADPWHFNRNIFEKSKLDSFMVWAQQAGKYTGFVTTTSITHATPAALYARINHREWECDTEIPEEYRYEIKDIARQLIEDEPGKNFKVILGGGQQQMGYVRNIKVDRCSREDNRNLTQIWIDTHNPDKSKFVVNTQQLEEVSEGTEFLLGLFDSNHMPFELVRNTGPTGTPSLSSMTKKALQILKKGPNGFVLMVEGGLIDQAHHKNYARLALEETAELDEAVQIALNNTGSETLILVTSDHSHSVTMSGYAKRGNDILGFGNESTEDAMPYLTVSYGNGPGFKYHYQPHDQNIMPPWRDVSTDNNRLHDPWYQHVATFFREEDTHGGEDVPIHAIGPGSHLIKGVIEQNTIAHIISYAACIGPQAHLNQHCSKNASCRMPAVHPIIVILFSYLTSWY